MALPRKASALFATLLLTFAASYADVRADHIPAFHGTTFAGAAVTLPRDLGARAGVLVLGFTRESQGSAREWGYALARCYPVGSGVAYYEMPVLTGVPGLLRGWVLGRIRNDVSQAGRAHFLPVLSDEDGWKRAAGEGDYAAATVLVIDRSGSIDWRFHGSATNSALVELQQQVARVQREK